MNNDIDDILSFFDRTSDQFFSKAEFIEKLSSGKKLRVKYGVDVTAPTLHLGHAVNLWLMRYLQDRGHKVIFLIGDFTTRIGDPDGQSETRPVIPREEIDKNAEAFITQAKMVLRFDSPDLLEIRRNSEWLDKMKLPDFMNLLSMVTQAKLISRDMFQKRLAEGKEIYMHEMLYPILQGYDSVEIKSDLTIIGSDQLFNEMMGRFFQEKMGQKPQTIITSKITPGIDAKAKQSKSLGNYIGLAHTPRDKFGRVMSIPDQLIEEYLRIYTLLPLAEIEKLKEEIKKDPRAAKLKLAHAIVSRYHGNEIAEWELEWFSNTISKGLQPKDIPTLAVVTQRMRLLDLVALARPAKSKSDTRRLIQQGGIELNSNKVDDPEMLVTLHNNDVLKTGKRTWHKIEIVDINLLETESLWLKPLKIEDVDPLRQYLPEWEIVKYLTKPSNAKKVPDSIAVEVFKKVIQQPEPRDEWLWKIEEKKVPDKIIGVAHLRSDTEHGNHNIWLDKKHREAGTMQEVFTAISQHAFSNLGFQNLVFKSAFGHAAAVPEMEELTKRFMRLDPNAKRQEDPGADWGITREGWQSFQQMFLRHPPKPTGK